MRTSYLLTIVFVILLVAGAVTYAVLRPKENPSGKEDHITVTDGLGRSVQIGLPINNVLIIGKARSPIVSVAYMFPTAKDRIYCVTETVAEAPLFRMIDPDIDSKRVDGLDVTIPNIEEIAAKDPDVVILKSYMKADLGDPLESLGIKVVYVDLEDRDTYQRDVGVLGKIFEDEARAEEITNYYQEKHEYILSRTDSIPNEERPTVLFLYHSTKGGTISFKVPGAEWLQTSMIEAAGGYPLSKELAGTGWNIVSFEQIAQWDPDIILLVTYLDDPSPSDIRDELSDDPMWKSLDAVKEGKVYAFPDDCNNVCSTGSWDSPGSRWILGLAWMTEKIHPVLFGDLNLTEEARDFYTRMYGLAGDDANTVMNGITGDLE